MLLEAIEGALLRMLARGLESAPSADEVPLRAFVMCDDLKAAGYRDEHEKRIIDALDYLGRNQSRWPTPHDVICRMRTQASQPQVYRSLPAPNNREVGRAYLDKLKALCADGIGKPLPYDPAKRVES